MKIEFNNNKEKYEELLINKNNIIDKLTVYKDYYNISKNQIIDNINNICIPIVKDYNNIIKEMFNIVCNIIKINFFNNIIR